MSNPVQISQETTNQNNSNNQKIYQAIPYINHISPKIQNIFKNETNIQITQKYTKTINNIHSKLKDKENNLKKAGVVYSIPCQDCSKTYIGHTSRVLKDRLTSHKSDIKLNKRSCTLAEHNIDSNHFADFSNSKVLHVEQNYQKRLLLEAFETYLDPENLNHKKNTNNIIDHYSYLLSLNKSFNK